MIANPSKFQLMVLSKYKNIEKNMSFDEKNIKLSDVINYLELPETKISTLNGIDKIFVAEQITKAKLFLEISKP